MDIILVNPRLKSWSPNIYVPLGIAYIAAVLEQAGHNIGIIDLNMERTNAREFQKKTASADIVGITGMITECKEVLKLVKTIKKANTKTLVVLGGPLATTMPQGLLQASLADFIVVGEGEKTIVDLVSAIEQKSDLNDIKGIAYRDNNRVIITKPVEHINDLDVIPFPSRHLLDMNRYLKNCFENFNVDVAEFGDVKSTNVSTCRGCPYSCTFCFKGMWGHKWRGRSPENIVEEIKLLHDTYGVNGFFFDDEVFVFSQERVFTFCRLLKNERLKVAWHCNCRVDLMTKEMLEVMYDAGCRDVAYGIESGSQRILHSMKKNITLDQVRAAVRWSKEAGIHVTGYFIIGMMGETTETIEETMTFARELNLPLYGFSLVMPLPGTELYNSALNANLISGNLTALKDMNLNVNANLTQDCSSSALAAFARKAFREFYLKNRFGRYYFLSPYLMKIAVKTLVSLRSKEQILGLLHRVWNTIH